MSHKRLVIRKTKGIYFINPLNMLVFCSSDIDVIYPTRKTPNPWLGRKSKSPREEVYNDDPTSIATSTASTSTVSSLNTLPPKNRLDELSRVNEKIKVRNDTPSTWSASSTDIDEYLERFRRNLIERKVETPTKIPNQRKLTISEEEAETLSSLQTHACIARTISTESIEE